MKNTGELRTQLVEVFTAIKDGTMDVSKGKTLVAASNAMLKSAQLELEQNKLLNTSKECKFINS